MQRIRCDIRAAVPHSLWQSSRMSHRMRRRCPTEFSDAWARMRMTRVAARRLGVRKPIGKQRKSQGLRARAGLIHVSCCKIKYTWWQPHVVWRRHCRAQHGIVVGPMHDEHCVHCTVSHCTSAWIPGPGTMCLETNSQLQIAPRTREHTMLRHRPHAAPEGQRSRLEPSNTP